MEIIIMTPVAAQPIFLMIASSTDVYPRYINTAQLEPSIIKIAKIRYVSFLLFKLEKMSLKCWPASNAPKGIKLRAKR